MPRRTRYQQGSVQREKRQSGSDVWVFSAGGNPPLMERANAGRQWSVLSRHFRLKPASCKSNWHSQEIGWHTFRHPFGTLLKANGEDVKTVQELLRHANSRITLDVYTQAVNSNKRAAQSKVVRMIVSDVGLIGPLSDPDLIVTVGRRLILRSLESLAGTTGLEPATSAVTGQNSGVTYRK
jgi:hypothetical protein